MKSKICEHKKNNFNIVSIKTINFVCLLLIVTLTSNAQNVFPTAVNSNVGIGTTAPTTRLQVTSATPGTSGIRLTNLTNAVGTTTGNGKALSVDALGNVVLVPVLNTAPIVNNIYNNNGTLLDNRTITMNGKNLTINPSTANSQFFINGNTGNLGLGTLTPNTKIAIQGDNQSVSVSSTFFNYSSGNPIGAQFGTWSGGVAGIKFHRWTGVGTLYSNAYIGQSFYNDEYGLDFKTNNLSAFGDASSSRMFIKLNGNIGVGTTNPSTKLEINSGVNGTSGLKFTQLNATSPTTANVASLGVDSNGNVVVSSSNVLPLSVIYSSSFPSLDSAINTLNTTTTIGTLIIDKSTTLLLPATLKAEKSIKFLNGNVINLNTNTLTINGAIDAGAFQIFAGTGSVNGNPKIAHVLPHWWQSITGNDWTASIQNAVNFYSRVYFPSGNYYVNQTIMLSTDLSHFLYGNGISSKFICNNNDYVFKLKPSIYSTYEIGLLFENLSFYSLNGIQFNDKTTFFNDDTKYDFIINTKITGCFFKSPTPNSGIAIQFNKVFDSEISNNQIDGFRIGINLRGSDINTISKNRIVAFHNYAILEESFGTLGSQNGIYNNDLLAYVGEQNKGAFIKTSSRHVLIKDNYFENITTKVRSLIDCSNFGLEEKSNNEPKSFPIKIDLRGNRLDIGDNAIFTYLIQDDFSSLIIDNDKNTNTFKHPSSKFISKDGLTYSDFLKSRFNNMVYKEIHIKSCESFGEWNNFSTATVFANTTNGGVLIDSKNVSSSISVINHNDPNIYFNPLKFKIEASADKINLIEFKQGITNGEKELFKNVKIKIVLKGQNLNQSGSLYMRADSGNVTNPNYYYSSNLSLNGDYTIIEYLPNIDYIDKLSITSSLNFFIKTIELIPVVSANKQINTNGTEDISERLKKLEEKINLYNTELLLLKSTENKNAFNSNIIEIIPNPIGDLLSIQFNTLNEDSFNFNLFDVSGKLLLEERFTNKSLNYSINVNFLPKNSYIYKIYNEKFVKTGVILKN